MISSQLPDSRPGAIEVGFLVLSSGESREEAGWWLGHAPPGRVRRVEETGGILQTIALETGEELQGDPLFGVQIL